MRVELAVCPQAQLQGDRLLKNFELLRDTSTESTDSVPELQHLHELVELLHQAIVESAFRVRHAKQTVQVSGISMPRRAPHSLQLILSRW